MSIKPILIVAGEPNSIFLEIYFKAIKVLKIKSPLILIASAKLVKLQMKKLNVKKKIKIIEEEEIIHSKLNNKNINILNIKYKQSKTFDVISSKSNKYISECFDAAIKILKTKKTNKLINGPISKKTFLKKNFLGITEYISSKFNIKKSAMLIYNKDLSVCPVTTHLPLKFVAKKINRKIVSEKVKLINNFYKIRLNKKPKIAILGLNPHCESVDKFNEDQKIISPAIRNLKKKYNVYGPFSADTIFLKKNRVKYDVILGMYHDQVLTPIKTLYEYDAINITLGLPFLRISPDHGPNEKMIGKNISNPLSLIKSISFLDKN